MLSNQPKLILRSHSREMDVFDLGMGWTICGLKNLRRCFVIHSEYTVICRFGVHVRFSYSVIL